MLYLPNNVVAAVIALADRKTELKKLSNGPHFILSEPIIGYINSYLQFSILCRIEWSWICDNGISYKTASSNIIKCVILTGLEKHIF